MKTKPKNLLFVLSVSSVLKAFAFPAYATRYYCSPMHEAFKDGLEFSLIAFSSIFFLVDPFAAVPSFLAITAGSESNRRRRMASRAAITCFIVLNAFALAGGLIFRFFGITLPAFAIAVVVI